MAKTKKKKSTKSAAAKGAGSLKMGTDDLKELIKSAVKEAMGDDEPGEEAEPLEGVTSEDVLSVIEQAVDAVSEKHKAAKDAGEEDTDITTEEIVEEAAALLSELSAPDEGDDGALSEDEGDEKEDDEEDCTKEDEGEEDDSLKRRKAASGAAKRQKKSGRPVQPAQRKYADVFMGGSGRASSKKQKAIPPMVQLARAIKCLDVFGRNDPERAAFYAKKHYQDSEMEREFKALSATNPVNGGFLVPEVYTDDIIELLYNKTVIKELGARTIPLESGNLTMPRMTSGTRAMWGGEARKIKTTQPTFGTLRLSAKRLEAIVPMTRELIMSTKFSADEIFAADLSRRMQLGLDWGGLYGKGGEFQPVGIANTPGIEVVDAKTMDEQYADSEGRVTADFPVYIKSLVMSKNVDDTSLGWAFNSFMEGYLMNLKTATGDYLYRDEMNAGKFLGIPYAVTNQIGWDKNGYTDIFFGNWSDMMIGDQMGLETFTTLEGSWTDEDGIVHNAFEENLTGTRALMYDDIGVRHVEAFVYVKNVKCF
jgi:HK97 family phage major capsid protein